MISRKYKNSLLRCVVALYCALLLTSFANAQAVQGVRVKTVVIDPGHGGHDPGAIGPANHHEADLALAVSLKFGKMMQENFPDLKIIYTRTTDKFVSLAERANIANKAKADLFICIHLNSSTNREAFGTSTYVLGLHRTEDNLEIAKRENSVVEMENDNDRSKNYEFDPNSPEGHIIMSMKQNAFLDQSILIASKIEDELAKLAKRKSRGVKQAGFWVLYKTAMPSLLAEIGFISNPTEEKYLASDEGQTAIATSLLRAFRSYKYEIEGLKEEPKDELPAMKDMDKKAETPTKQEEKPVEQKPAVVTKEESINAVKKVDAPTTQEEKLTLKNEPKTVLKNATSDPEKNKVEEGAWSPEGEVKYTGPPKPKITKELASVMEKERALQNTDKPKVPIQPVEETNTLATNPVVVNRMPVEKPKTEKPVTEVAKKEVAKTTPRPVTQKTEKPKEEKTIEPMQGVVFRVQLVASKIPPKNLKQLKETFPKIIEEKVSNELTRYMAGDFVQYAKAKSMLLVAEALGYKDAFVIAYRDGKRLNAKQTQELLQEQ